MHRLPRAHSCALAAMTAFGFAASNHVNAEMSDFDTSLTPLSGSSFQLNETFDILYSGAEIYFDFDLDNVVDQTVPLGAPDTLANYSDPEHYVLDFALPGSGDVLKPYFMGSELSAAAEVDWRLSYVTTPGDGSTIYSTIMSGSADYIGGGLILNITDGLEWPVNGMPANDLGIPEGTHVAAGIADFTSFTFTYPGQAGPAGLAANVIPAPGALALLGLGGLAARRRRS
jgi:hypothetical protein